jgi:hypothetical protein
MNCGLIASARRRTIPAGTFLVGNNAARTTYTAVAGDVQQGIIAQAGTSGTANSIVIEGPSSNLTGVNFRLTVYAATSSTVIGGALLGKSSDQTALNTGSNSFSLVSPITITAGNWYALMLHGGSGTWAGTGSNGSLSDRFFSDTFSDGPVDPAPNSGLNSSNGRMIYLTT